MSNLKKNDLLEFIEKSFQKNFINLSIREQAKIGSVVAECNKCPLQNCGFSCKKAWRNALMEAKDD